MVGILNGAQACGSGKPEYYADVYYFVDWIQFHIESKNTTAKKDENDGFEDVYSDDISDDDV